MSYAEIQGNTSLKEALAGMVASGHVPHAILLHEDDGGGGVPLALAFLQQLYCTARTPQDSCGACPACNKVSKLIHPDIHFFFPETTGTPCRDQLGAWRELVLGNPYFTESDLQEALGIEGKSTQISVAEAKAILEALSLHSLEGGYSSVLIYLPERMNREASNRLLKMIEEPPERVQFVLVTHAPEKLLTTVRSRCQQFRVEPRPGAGGVQFADTALWDSLMEALLARDLPTALDAGERIAALPSRDAAKTFCDKLAQ